MAEVRFDLDIVVNDLLVGSAVYSTSSTGEYLIKKKVGEYAPRGTHKYIARTRMQGCPTVTDTDYTIIYVNNPFFAPPSEMNMSRFEFVVDYNPPHNQPLHL